MLVNSGKGPQPNTERNLQLLQDYEVGITVDDLVIKYRISATRIYNILRPLYKKMGKQFKRNPRLPESERTYDGQVFSSKGAMQAYIRAKKQK